jgi:uncharacterized protein (DUF1330 family)
MPAYYIGERIVFNFAVFDEYLAKVMPMIERFGGRYLGWARTKSWRGIGSRTGWLLLNSPTLHRSKIGTGRQNISRSSHCAEAPRLT